MLSAPPRFKGVYVEEVMRIANPAIDEMGIRSYLRDVGLCPRTTSAGTWARA